MSTELKTYEVLERALGLIEREENWCDHFPGISPDGKERCAVHAVKAIVGCFDGGFGWTEQAKEVVDVLKDYTNPLGVASWNDTHTHAEVVALFQTAIRAEKQKAGALVDLPTSKPLTKIPA